LYGFRGLGYDSRFVATVFRVIDGLKDNPQTMIEITNSGDFICASCPHYSEDGCHKNGHRSEASVRRTDDRVMEKINIVPETTIKAEEVFRKIDAAIAPEDLDDICEGCEWLHHGYCVEGLKTKRESPWLQRWEMGIR